MYKYCAQLIYGYIPLEDSMKKTILWLQELLISMGNALFHPYKDNAPPSFEAQPFRDDPYKNRGIAQGKVSIVFNFKERSKWASFLLAI